MCRPVSTLHRVLPKWHLLQRCIAPLCLSTVRLMLMLVLLVVMGCSCRMLSLQLGCGAACPQVVEVLCLPQSVPLSVHDVARQQPTIIRLAARLGLSAATVSQQVLALHSQCIASATYCSVRTPLCDSCVLCRFCRSLARAGPTAELTNTLQGGMRSTRLQRPATRDCCWEWCPRCATQRLECILLQSQHLQELAQQPSLTCGTEVPYLDMQQARHMVVVRPTAETFMLHTPLAVHSHERPRSSPA